jgi:lipoprotein-releasing system permease protein
MPFELFVALRYLRFHRGRAFLSLITVISVAGVCVGTAALVIALALNAGFVLDVRNRILSGSSHLTLLNADDTLFQGVPEIVAQAESVPGVAAVCPVLFSPSMVVVEGLGDPGFAEIHGIDPEAHGRVIETPDGINPFPALSAPTRSGRGGIVLGTELAESIGAIEGDLVRVLVPQIHLTPFATVPRSRTFELVGIHQSGHFPQDSQRAWIRLDAARKLLRAEDRASWIEVRLDDLRDVEPMQRTLKAFLGPPWLVIDLIEQNQDIIKALNTEKKLLFAAIGLMVVLAALNIVSTLILMVAGKMKEIGTLSAMGARPAGIARVFVLQGCVIGVVGTFSGLVLGTGIAYVLDRFRLFPLDPQVYFLSHLPFAPQPMDIVVVGVCALAISLLATIYPAMKAARMDPVDAIRYE